MLRRVVATALVGLLTAGSAVGATSPATAAENPDGLARRQAAALDSMVVPVPLHVPAPRGRAATPSVSVGSTLTVRWADQSYDKELNARYAVLALEGATEGTAYSLELEGKGPLQALVVDSEGEVVAYAGHPDAYFPAPRLEWEYAEGDLIVLISDELPLDMGTARLTVTPYTGDGSVHLPEADLKAGWGPVSGDLTPYRPSIPFHGGHADQAWTKPSGYVAGQDELVLVFEGSPEETDWLAVLILDEQDQPVELVPVEDGVAVLDLTDGQSFTVTSLLPDDFGSYSFDWVLMAGAPRVTATTLYGSTTPTSVPAYRVDWDAGGPALASFGTDDSTPSYRVEVSSDGRTWRPAKLQSPIGAAETFAYVELWNGDWQVRVVEERDGEETTSPAQRLVATADEAGWRVSAIRFRTQSGVLHTAGKGTDFRDLRNSAVVTQTYRDGTTRTRTVTPTRVQFRHAGQSTWLRLGTTSAPSGDYHLLGSGTLRVTDDSGKVVSNEVPVTVLKGTDTYKGSFAKPTNSRKVGGAVEIRGTVWQKYPDGSWQVARNGQWYQVQKKSGRSWKKVHSGQVKSSGKGQVAATVPLPGKGKYRLVVSGKTIAAWTLNPATATKTAKVAKPVVTRAGKNRYAIGVDIDQRFSDGRWGQGSFGWTYQAQYRPVGTKKWKSADKPTKPEAKEFTTYLRTGSGQQEFRIVAKYKGKTHTSAITRG